MLNVEIDSKNRIATLQPHGTLLESDFVKASKAIDPCIAEHGGLLGLIIYTEDFPGWDSFAALVGHMKFVKNHHARISKVALVTNSKIGGLGEKLGGHFLAAKIRHFPYDQLDDAKGWILSGADK